MSRWRHRRQHRSTKSDLRVGLQPHLARPEGRSGHTNMWRQVVHHLRTRVSIVVAPPDRIRRTAVDVWLGAGSGGPLPVDAPQALQVHDAGWNTPELLATMDPAFVELLDRRIGAAARSGAHIVTPSQAAADQVSSRYDVPVERVHPVLHGVDADLFRPGLDGGGSLVERAGGRADVPYLLYVGVAHPRKNIAALRTAMVRVAAAGFEHQLVLVVGRAQDRPNGDGLLDEAIAPLPGLPGRVVSITESPSDLELAALMAGASALCQPSLMEGFGLPVLESMACGTPVVVSNRGALPEVVAGAGVIVDPDAEGIASGLITVLSNNTLAASLATSGRSRALELSWERTADGWFHALQAARAG